MHLEHHRESPLRDYRSAVGAAAGSDHAAAFCRLDDALETLSKMDPRRAQVIELRFFGGLSVEETAEVLGISPRLVRRDWKVARDWLARELNHV